MRIEELLITIENEISRLEKLNSTSNLLIEILLKTVLESRSKLDIIKSFEEALTKRDLKLLISSKQGLTACGNGNKIIELKFVPKT